MKYDVIDYGGETYHTGNLLCGKDDRKLRAPAMPKKLQLSKSEIADILRDKKRMKARREFTPNIIYNQGSVGSCNGCAAAKGLERIDIRAGRSWVRYSPEYIYSHINGGRDVGSMLDDGMEWMMQNGVCPWKQSHHQKYKPHYFSAEDHRDAAKHKALECYGVKTELEIAGALAQGFVVIVALHAANSFMRLDVRGVAGSSRGPGNHAVGIDDAIIDDGELLFDMFNSWGTNYGQDGRAYVTFDDHFAEPIRHHFFYAIRGVTTNPDDDIPELQLQTAA